MKSYFSGLSWFILVYIQEDYINIGTNLKHVASLYGV